ncbi:MAG: hypothetical protein IPM56_01765 [Ignavibacteriales bacterium]|nr:MAG: hypothetical protein IPM56_01765 [Ignavibacteriales bacterium]
MNLKNRFSASSLGIFLTIFSSFNFCQTDITKDFPQDRTYSRFRFATGLSILYEDIEFESGLSFNPSFLFAFRHSLLNLSSNPVDADFAFETGVKILIVDHNKSSAIALPFIKANPDIYLVENFFMGISTGLMFSFYSGESNFFWPFAGMNFLILSKLNENIFFEFEFGTDIIAIPDGDGLLMLYFNIGFGFK